MPAWLQIAILFSVLTSIVTASGFALAIVRGRRIALQKSRLAQHRQLVLSAHRAVDGATAAALRAQADEIEAHFKQANSRPSRLLLGVRGSPIGAVGAPALVITHTSYVNILCFAPVDEIIRGIWHSIASGHFALIAAVGTACAFTILYDETRMKGDFGEPAE